MICRPLKHRDVFRMERVYVFRIFENADVVHRSLFRRSLHVVLSGTALQLQSRRIAAGRELTATRYVLQHTDIHYH